MGVTILPTIPFAITVAFCLCFIACDVEGKGPDTGEVRLGVILPFHGNYPWLMPKTLPAIRYAVDSVRRKHILPHHRLRIVTADSNCSQTNAPLEAVDMYINGTANVFLGPGCNYAIAPIARFSYHWRIPLITPGGLVSAFRDKSEYRLLTRILATYDKTADIFAAAFRRFKWSKIGILYHDNRGANQGKSECYFKLEGIYSSMRDNFHIYPWIKSFDENLGQVSVKDLLIEASKNTRSKTTLERESERVK